jgi:putative membrane protein
VQPDFRAALANERTLLSWFRCALVLIALGLATGTLGDISPRWLHAALAVAPIVIALWAIVLGFVRWQRVDTALRDGSLVPPQRDIRFAVLTIVVIAVLAATATFAHLLL